MNDELKQRVEHGWANHSFFGHGRSAACPTCGHSGADRKAVALEGAPGCVGLACNRCGHTHVFTLDQLQNFLAGNF